MTNAEKLKESRVRARAEGRCSICRARAARPCRLTCQHCVDRAKANKHRTKLEGRLCGNCFVDLGGRRGMTNCIKCQDKITKRRALLDQARRSAGVCLRCSARQLATPTMCLACAEYQRIRMLEFRRANGASPRRCSLCTQLGLPGIDHDRRSHDRVAGPHATTA